MPSTLVTRGFLTLLVVSVTTCGILYLFKDDTLFSQQWTGLRTADTSAVISVDGDVKSTQEKKYSLPLPDAQHPVVSANRPSNLRQIGRGPNSKMIAQLKTADRVNSRGGTIVSRHRANTSTNQEPTSEAGRLAAPFVGRIGNWMNIYAGLYGIARRNGMRHVISANNPLLKLFRLNATVVPGDRPGQHWLHYAVTNVYDQHTEYLDPRIDIELVGYFNNLRYYGHVMRDLVQNHFRFHDAIQQDADNFLRRSMAKFDLSPSDVAVIAVHIRRTDMLRIRVKAGRPAAVAGREYLTHTVAFFNSLFKNKTMYVVCSDDMEWAKANFVTESPTVLSVAHTASVDFAILSRCNHSIITMGTYGKWSAYLAGGVTVYHDHSAPTEVPLDVLKRKHKSNQSPTLAWIALS